MSKLQNSKNTESKSITFARKFFKTLNGFVDLAAGTATFLIIVTVVIQILGRSLRNPAPWTEEATRFIFIWLIFLGISMGFRQGESARVTILLEYLPKGVAKFSTYIYVVFSMGFFAFMILYGYRVMMQQVNMNEMGSAMRIPMWTIGASVPVSGVLGIFGILESILFHPNKLEV